MAYTPLLSTEIEAGDPVKEELFSKIKNNEDYFNTQIDGLQQTAVVDVYNLTMTGNMNTYSLVQLAERIPVYKCITDGTLVSFVVTLLEVSTSGTLSVDIEKSTDDGITWSSLLTSDVNLTGTAVGSLSGTVNWINPAAQDFLQTDLLRIVVSGLQVAQGSFNVSIYAEVA